MVSLQNHFFLLGLQHVLKIQSQPLPIWAPLGEYDHVFFLGLLPLSLYAAAFSINCLTNFGFIVPIVTLRMQYIRQH